MMRRAVLLAILATLPACSRERPLFVEANAQAHVRTLAGTIGSRPVGTPANARARAYIVDQLQGFGYAVRIQELDAARPELGRTARVANVIAVLPGERPEAVGVVSHYDSSPYGPGAADAALGVGVALETARVMAARPSRRWTLFVLLTDAEEVGLMGAAGLLTERAVMERLRAYINLEAIGSAGVPLLFEAGPGNAWILQPWKRRAPFPRGSSYALEIYRRLPNDTDFSILKTRDIPGLNFAAVDDSHAYHTDRDTPDRLSARTVRAMGENVVAIVTALDDLDIARRTPEPAVYFDLLRTAAVIYGPEMQSILAIAALLLGFIAWVRLTRSAVHESGFARWALMLVWAWAGFAASAGGMVLATWLLRSAREVYHPWYASPGRLFLLLITVGVTVGWGVARIGQWLPRRAHPARHPALTWSITLPVWLALAAGAAWFAPAAAHLWVLPLLAAGLMFSWIPAGAAALVRLGSMVTFGAAAIFWLRDSHDLLRFSVAVMGRMPFITPVWLFAAALALAGVMLVPPLVGALATGRPGRRPFVVTSLLLLACAASAVAAYVAPAYTVESPLRRQVRAIQDARLETALWEVGSLEPGLDLHPDAPAGWRPAQGTPAPLVPWERFALPFVWRTEAQGLGPAPLAISDFSLRPLPDGIELHLGVVPREGGLYVSFLLPQDVAPLHSSLPGVLRLGRWTATFVAPPPEGLAWTATFRGVTAEQLRETMVAVTATGFPGEAGPYRLPGWLPRERAVWAATATWLVPATSGPAIAPVPPLR